MRLGVIDFGRLVPVFAIFTAACSDAGVVQDDPTSSLQQGLAGGGGSGVGGGGGSITVQVGLDTYVAENDSANYWDRNRVSVRGDGSGSAPVLVGLLIFDMGVPPPVPCTVTFANIVIWRLSTSNQSFKLYPANRVWTDNQANWTLAKSGVPWEVPGAMGPTDRGPAFHEFTPSAVGTQNMVLNAAGRALVQSWIFQPGANKGLVIGHETHGDGFSFASTEHFPTNRRPMLIYTCQ